MNKELKTAILETIKYSAIEYTQLPTPRTTRHLYSIVAPNYGLSIDSIETTDYRGAIYTIKYYDKATDIVHKLLDEVYVPHSLPPVHSAKAADVLEIWNMAQKKYHAQQREKAMKADQKIALRGLTERLEHIR